MKGALLSVLGGGIVIVSFIVGAGVVAVVLQLTENHVVFGGIPRLPFMLIPWVFGWVTYKLVKRYLVKR